MSEYPVEILPHESYKAKMDVDSLASHEENACVVRRVAENLNWIWCLGLWYL